MAEEEWEMVGEKEVTVRVFRHKITGVFVYEVGGPNVPWGGGTLTVEEWEQIKGEFHK